ncbi:MAG: PilZ domain-containing protein [Terriglobales bacterium]
MSESAVARSPDYATIRRWQRHKVNVPIRVIVSRALKASIFDGRGTSLSEGGMALFAGAELRTGDQVIIEFTPPFSSASIRVDAAIRNRTGYHYGVEFLAVDHAQRQQVTRLRSWLALLSAPEGSLQA